jgi:hypothetical protein
MVKSCVLSWDEKYPASYVFVPSPVFKKWAEDSSVTPEQSVDDER